jgi:hypothetical protein
MECISQLPNHVFWVSTNILEPGAKFRISLHVIYLSRCVDSNSSLSTLFIQTLWSKSPWLDLFGRPYYIARGCAPELLSNSKFGREEAVFDV